MYSQREVTRRSMPGSYAAAFACGEAISLDPCGREVDAEVYCEECAKQLGLQWQYFPMKKAPGLIALILVCSGCSKSATQSDSYRSQTRCRYPTLHGDVQIEAVCRYSTYTPRGTNKTDDAHCLSTPLVGQETQREVRRGRLAVY